MRVAAVSSAGAEGRQPPRGGWYYSYYVFGHTSNDKLIKETQIVWIKYTRSRAECYTHDT
jgi:hypothetical protein